MFDAQMVVPCYNPRAGWGQTLVQRFTRFCEALPNDNIGLVLVHDGSPKPLAQDQLNLAKAIPNMIYLEHEFNRGKGAALRTGVAACTAPHVIMTDIDLPYTDASMLSLWDTLKAQGGVVAGQRSSSYYVHVPFFRRMLSHFHRSMMKVVFRLPVQDSQAGLKGFDQSGKEVFLSTTIDRFLVDLEFLARSNKKIPVHPVAVHLRPGVVFTDFGLGILVGEIGNFWRIMLGAWLGW